MMMTNRLETTTPALTKYIRKICNLETSCLTQKEKDELMELLYKYKDSFSLRDEIGTFPNIDLEIYMVDKSYSS